MPTPDSDTNDSKRDNIYTLLLIVAAVFFFAAVIIQYMELDSEYEWLTEKQPSAEVSAE